MRLTTLITASILALGAACALPPMPSAQAAPFPIPFPGGGITGVVQSVTTGQPIGKGATVTLTRKGVGIDSTNTDADGAFFFGNLRPGTYTLTTAGGSRTVSIGSFSAFVTIFGK